MTKLIAMILAFAAIAVSAQNSAVGVKKYVLDNGLTVYLNEDRTAKEVFGAVVVKAGSKNDPADATGMAHYLEHLLFKGTTEIGTTNYAREKPFLDSINSYYDLLGKTKDETERKKIQHLINNQSLQASKFGLPTEFDKLIKSIGGINLNAFTENDMTVYHNSFPGEQIDKWLELYSHRFRNPVFRSFQAELEVVYEEKNMGMDSYWTPLFEDMSKNMFRHHPYGTQTVIGTVEHLKNPSLTKMYEYFNTYYVANNMALVLCGNFDAEKALPIIKEKFSKLRTAPVPEFPKYPKTVFKGKESVEVKYTPIKMELIGFKSIPTIHPDKAALEVCISLLYNEAETGKLNKLERDNKILFAECFQEAYNDDGCLIFFVAPKLIGQSFEEAETLVLSEVQKLKNGEVSDTDLKIIKTELYRQRQQALENLENRAISIVQAFSAGVSWEEYLNYSKELEKVTKDDVIRVAKQYLGDNYFVMYSKKGSPKKEKVVKPGFKPVVVEEKEGSAYAKQIKSMHVNNAEPRFLDLDRDTKLMQLNESNKLYVTQNPVNDLFSLEIDFKVGTDSIKDLEVIKDVFSRFYTKDMTADKLKEEFALLGVTSYADCNDQRFLIRFDGLESNFPQALPLINKLLNECIVDQKTVKSVCDEILASRKLDEKEPQVLGEALAGYVRLGNKSSFVDRISKQGLKQMTADRIIKQYKNAIAYNAVWHYVGATEADKVHALLKSNLILANNKKEVPLMVKKNNISAENIIYLVNDKKAVQTQIDFLINSDNYTSDPQLDARIHAFNQYMGGDFSGLILQEIREYRSLAYGASGGFRTPKLQNYPCYFSSYIGCQADKTNEAIDVMCDLVKNMPQKPERIEGIKSLLRNSISSAYPGFRSISEDVENLRERGYKSLPLKATYNEYESLAFNDIVGFYETYIKNKPLIISIYGDKSKIDLAKLSKYGKIVELKKDQIILE